MLCYPRRIGCPQLRFVYLDIHRRLLNWEIPCNRPRRTRDDLDNLHSNSACTERLNRITPRAFPPGLHRDDRHDAWHDYGHAERLPARVRGCGARREHVLGQPCGHNARPWSRRLLRARRWPDGRHGRRHGRGHGRLNGRHAGRYAYLSPVGPGLDGSDY